MSTQSRQPIYASQSHTADPEILSPDHQMHKPQEYARTPPPPFAQPIATPSSAPSHHHTAFAQQFGLHPAIALFVILVNAMVFGSNMFTPLVATLLGLFLCIPVGVITYLGQRKWYEDDSLSAGLKAAILTILTAIPVGIPVLLAAPAGIVGWLANRKQVSAGN